MSSNGNFLVAILSSALIGFGVRGVVDTRFDSHLNGKEVQTSALTTTGSGRMTSLVEHFAKADFQKIIAEQDPEKRKVAIELLAKNPDAIINLQLLANQYESLVAAANDKILADQAALNAKLGFSTIEPTPEAVAPNKPAEINHKR